MTSEGDEDLLYRVTDNNALQAPAAGMAEGEQHDWSGWEKWLRRHLDNERTVMVEAIGIVAAETRKEMLQERDAAIAPLKAEIAELRGQVSALLTLLGQKSVSKVIDLPSWRAKDVG
jgi:hypothetical protein